MSAAPRPSRRQRLQEQPGAFGFFVTMRGLELSHPERPRIGRNRHLTDEVVTPGQDPWLSFPAAELTDFTERPGRPPRLATRFMGYFGPHGALPLNISQEAWHWFRSRDSAFVDFVDIFATRFQQLFYRVWADARPIAQVDLAADTGRNDRFRGQFAALIGWDPARLGGLAGLEAQLLPLAGLLQGRVRSAARLRQLLRRSLGLELQIDEHCLGWLQLEPEDCTLLGRANARLGGDLRLGSRVPSVNERIRLRLTCPDLPSYLALMPGGTEAARVAGLVGAALDLGAEAELQACLPADRLPRLCLGASILGQTAWLAGAVPGAGPDRPVCGGAHRVPILSFANGSQNHERYQS